MKRALVKPLISPIYGGLTGVLVNALELWTPSDLSGVIEWWDAGAGVTTATGASSWAGVLGNLTATQATASRQPAYDTSGIPKLVGDGVDDRLVFSADSLPFGADPVTIFCISKSRSVTGAAGAITGYGGGVSPNALTLHHYTANMIARNGTDNALIAVADQPSVLVLRSPPSTGDPITLNANGAQSDETFTAAMNLTNNNGNAYIFGRALFGNWNADADIYALGYIEGYASDADTQRIEGWAAHKLNNAGVSDILTALPVDHPYKTEAPTK